jgi:hypothetical protein
MTDTPRPARAERDLLRTGAHAFEHHDIPEHWAQAFCYSDATVFEDEHDDAWNEAAASRFEAGLAERGYAFAGLTGDGDEFGEFNGVRGRLQRVSFTSGEVFDRDEAEDVWALAGCDAAPTEYVLRRGLDGVVRLPACFEPRLLDPQAHCDEPRTSGVLPDHVAADVGERAPARPQDGCADACELDEAWTNAACDAAVLLLERDGWTVETGLSATIRLGWHGGLYGETMLFVVTRDRLASRGIPPGSGSAPKPYTLPSRRTGKEGQERRPVTGPGRRWVPGPTG